MKTVKIKSPAGKDYECFFNFRKYAQGGRVRLELADVRDGYPYATVTTNLPEEKLEEGEIIVKNYSENEGIYEQLLAQGIVGPTIRFASGGFPGLVVCKLLIDKE